MISSHICDGLLLFFSLALLQDGLKLTDFDSHEGDNEKTATWFENGLTRL